MSSIIAPIWGLATSILPARSNTERLQRRFGDRPMAHAVYQECFSAYAKNLLPLDRATLDQIEEIAERKELGEEMGRAWERILRPAHLDGSRRPIENEPLLQTALQAQFFFDQELNRLKTIDSYLRLKHERVLPEISLLKRAAADQKRVICCLRGRYTPQEQEFLKGIRAKAKVCQEVFEDRIEPSILMREELLREIDKQLKILQNEDKSEWVNPKSGALKQLLASIKEEKLTEISKAPLHKSLKDHAAVAIGDPFSEDARFILVKRGDRMSEELWERFISTADINELKSALDKEHAEPNHIIHVPYIKNSRTYWIPVCYEKVSDVAKFHADRDVGKKTRRIEIKKGIYARENREDRESFLRKIVQWSEKREATAGPDCHEGIALNRKMLSHILSGKHFNASARHVQNLGEYLYALPSSDAATLPGSYQEDPNFDQAIRLHDYLYQNQTDFYPLQKMRHNLEQALQIDFDAKRVRPRIDILAQNLHEISTTWSQNLTLFLEELRKPENRDVRMAFGDETLQNLEKLALVLQKFIREATSHSIADPLSARREILSRNGNQNELDEVWNRWKRIKDPEGIDQNLFEVFCAIDCAIKPLHASLLDLNVEFSRPSKKDGILKALSSKGLLLDLYDKAIPPIWQNQVRLSLIKKDLLEGTELSPLWLKEVETFANNEARVLRNEFERSRLSKEILAILSK